MSPGKPSQAAVPKKPERLNRKKAKRISKIEETRTKNDY